jgi:hypothetical protein
MGRQATDSTGCKAGQCPGGRGCGRKRKPSGNRMDRTIKRDGDIPPERVLTSHRSSRKRRREGDGKHGPNGWATNGTERSWLPAHRLAPDRLAQGGAESPKPALSDLPSGQGAALEAGASPDQAAPTQLRQCAGVCPAHHPSQPREAHAGDRRGTGDHARGAGRAGRRPPAVSALESHSGAARLYPQGQWEATPARHSDMSGILHLLAGDLGIQGLGRADRLPYPVYHRSIMATRVETTVGEQACATRQ